MAIAYRLDKLQTETLPVSFETGQQGVYKKYFPYRCQVMKIRSQVTKALAATDAGTITGVNAAGSSTGGVITHAASAAFGNEQTATPSDNNIVAKDSFYQLTTAKTTVGGAANVTLEVLVLDK